MGCDIHFFVEKRSKGALRQESLNKILETEEEVKDEWVTADTWIPNPVFPEYSKNPIQISSQFYTGRNYYLFGILADVRFSCPKTIVPKRGIPDNASNEVRSEYESWGSDAHSCTWATLTELINADWDYYDSLVENGTLNSFKETLNRLKEISNNTDNVRCVFWFDN